MSGYTVGQVARMAGVSVRTLHHYDQIGLLTPARRSKANYRLYGERELLRLQQILFFKALGMPLEEIGRILDDPTFDSLRALREHRRLVQAEVERRRQLLDTIDKTILRLQGDNVGMTDEELYEGLNRETMERYQREAREMYDPRLVAESERRLRSLSKAQWEVIKAEGDQVTKDLAALMDRDAGDPEVHQAIARHHAWIEHFYPASADVYRGLGQGYAAHTEFRAYYDRYRPGLADFLAKAMARYADEALDQGDS